MQVWWRALEVNLQSPNSAFVHGSTRGCQASLLGPRREKAGFYDSREFGEVRKFDAPRCSAGSEMHPSRRRHTRDADILAEGMYLTVGIAIAFVPGPCSMLQVRLSVPAVTYSTHDGLEQKPFTLCQSFCAT